MATTDNTYTFDTVVPKIRNHAINTSAVLRGPSLYGVASTRFQPRSNGTDTLKRPPIDARATRATQPAPSSSTTLPSYYTVQSLTLRATPQLDTALATTFSTALINSGADISIVTSTDHLTDLQSGTYTIELAGGSTTTAYTRGTILGLGPTLVLPTAAQPILSVRNLQCNGYTVTFPEINTPNTPGESHITYGTDTIQIVTEAAGRYQLNAFQAESLHLHHARFGHQSTRTTKAMALANNLPIKPPLTYCNDYQLAPDLFEDHVQKPFGPIDIDLFSSKHNKQVPTYCTEDFTDKDTHYHDAYKQNWHKPNKKLYGNQP
ncbi:hypothetical protein SARC_01068 [Sphaeroforma arctica JP610]|uniref:Uncharacterized protein n=1 Tax=Sphaeroforma arctica JP610 TaxID=667725 RepID=A0A0L0GD39_9EUKA|nr:hypothetical protein SARC_01068 [Sphaeroforma arctica JP610]KNC86806.1 hypothetical protein SARC_01068 [Sphaeroforma arctica JP610]|eukprot:XP_014160708.1 hypothetical protein SARC_01068 [Sphaeroforma arctica JP610]